MSRRPQPIAVQPDGARRAATLLIALALVAAGMLLSDAALTGDAGRSPASADVEPGDLAISYCPVAAGRGEDATVTVAASGDEAGRVTFVRHERGGATTSGEELAVEPGRRVRYEVPGGVPVSVRSRGGPITALWTVAGERSATGPCVGEPHAATYLSGLDTSLGSQASLHLFNPFTVDAVVRIRYGTAEGETELVRTESVAVEAGTTHTLDLTELQPEEPVLGVAVETQTGRVVVQGEVQRTHIDEDDDGPQGRALIPAVPAPAGTAYFASAADGGGWSSWLAVYNPNDREAAVRVHATDPDPESPVEEISVPAGGVARVDLAGRSASESFGVTVESLNDVPVVVTRLESQAGERAGLGASTGRAQPAERWATAGLAGGREDALSVYNPGAETVRVSATVGGVAVNPWQDRPLAAGARQTILLADVEGDWPAVLVADGPVVVEVVSVLAEGEDLGRVLGVAGPVPVPEETVRVPGVVRRPELSVTPVEVPDGE